MAAVVSSALKRAAGVHCVTCAGLAKASLSQRSNVDSLTPVCSQTCCKLALCGGSNFATTLSLKACPYRATCFLYCLRPCSFDFYRGDSYSDSGGSPNPVLLRYFAACDNAAMALLAEGILKLHWDQTVPVNVAHIVKQMGVGLQLQDTLATNAQLTITPDNRATITLNRQLPPALQRYAVAHALGHVALHHLRPGMSQHIPVSEDFRLDFDQRHAVEANDFALRLLMPEPALRYALEDMRARDLEELAHVFAVPALFVKQRLADLGLKLPAHAVRSKHSVIIDT